MKFVDFHTEKHIVLRPFATYSLLPSFSILTCNGSICIDRDLSFSATRSEPEKDYYELAWFSAEEVALLSSVIIGSHPEYGKVHFYPVCSPYYIKDEGQDLSCVEFIVELNKYLRRQIEVRYASADEFNFWDDLPPFLKNRPYQFNEYLRLSPEYQQFLFKRINPGDALLIRGLSHLLKCMMLKCLGKAFIDTACLEIYISLEATLQIILSRLRAAGNLNPSNRDASDYLLHAFKENYRLDRYYSDYYDDRIKAVHPKSRFGLAKFTPLYVDDLYMLYDDLLRNFEFLITDVPNCFEKYQAGDDC